MDNETQLSREQEILLLLHLRNLHLEITGAGYRALHVPRVRSLLLGCGLGFLAGILAFVITSVPLIYIINPNASDPSAEVSRIPGGVGLIALAMTWVMAAVITFLLQRRTKNKLAFSLAIAKTAFASAVDELAQTYPEWAAKIGLKDSLFTGSNLEKLLDSYTGGDHLLLTLTRVDPSGRVMAWAERRSGPAPLVEALAAVLPTLNHDWAADAAGILGMIQDQRAVEPLLCALEEKRPQVREAVVQALGQLGDRRAVEPLIALLKSGAVRDRIGAVKALGVLNDDRAVEPLLAVSADKAIQEYAVEALANLKCKGQHALDHKCVCRVCGLQFHDSHKCVCRRCGTTVHTLSAGSCKCAECGQMAHDWSYDGQFYRCQRCRAFGHSQAGNVTEMR